MKLFGIVCLALGLAYSGYLAALYLRQDGMVFPTRPLDTARLAAIRNYARTLERVTLTASDGTALAGYFLPRSRPEGRPAPAVLYFCGNAEEQTAFFLWAPGALPDLSLFGLDYRGYGASAGRPTETALKADALAAYDALAARLGPDVPIAVMGRSLGCALAAHVAASRRTAGLVLVTPFDSLAAVGRDAHPFAPVALLLKYPFDMAPDAARVTAPTLMLVAGADTLIPPRHAARLAKLWAGPKETRTIDGATHGGILDSPAYWPTIRHFLGRCFGTEPGGPVPETSRDPA